MKIKIIKLIISLDVPSTKFNEDLKNIDTGKNKLKLEVDTQSFNFQYLKILN